MKSYLRKALAYAEYIGLIDDLLRAGKTTGPNQSEQMFHFGRLNRQRMKRLANTAKLNPALIEKLRAVERPMIWLIITEGWCGDAAQSIPVIEKMARESPQIETRYLLRDENPKLMDRYLTHNARSIPKLIALDARTLEELGTWGPRPGPAMEYFFQLREGGMEKPLIMEKLQRWYLKDKEQTIQKEFGELLEIWGAVKKEAQTV